MLRKKFKCLIGYSDHTKGIGVALSSINYGACVIEKHFMLNSKEKTLDSNFSSDVKEMGNLVREINNSWQAIGKPKRILQKAKKFIKIIEGQYMLQKI